MCFFSRSLSLSVWCLLVLPCWCLLWCLSLMCWLISSSAVESVWCLPSCRRCTDSRENPGKLCSQSAPSFSQLLVTHRINPHWNTEIFVGKLELFLNLRNCRIQIHMDKKKISSFGSFCSVCSANIMFWRIFFFSEQVILSWELTTMSVWHHTWTDRAPTASSILELAFSLPFLSPFVGGKIHCRQQTTCRYFLLLFNIS